MEDFIFESKDIKQGEGCWQLGAMVELQGNPKQLLNVEFQLPTQIDTPI